jgi:uncharacterized protein (TIRG00374 family)
MVKANFLSVFKYLIFILIGFLLIYFSLKKIDLAEFYKSFSNGNYWIGLVVFMVSCLVYFIRIKRWNLILNQVNENATFMNNFSAIAFGYLVSFVVPRGGEVVRLVSIKKTDAVPLGKSIPSVVFERLVDVFCLAILITGVLLSEYFSANRLFLNLNLSQYFIQEKLLYLVGLGLLFLALAWILFKKFKEKLSWFIDYFHSTKTVFYLVKNLKFVSYTILIWFGYFLMTYLWFYIFNETQHLSIFQAFQVMVVGTMARSIPLPGGSIGAYHLAVAFALTSMQINNETALALAFVIHGFQTLFTIIFGLVGLIWLFFNNKKLTH